MTNRSPRERGDNALHLAARAGNLELVVEAISKASGEGELKELLSKQNHSGEIPLYVAAEFGYVDLVKEMVKHYDVESAGTRARNGYDAFHVAAKQGNLGVLKVLMAAIPELAMTVDLSNTTALHTAAARGHIAVVNFLLDHVCILATISRSNCKTALHSAARNGHLTVVKALLSKEPKISRKIDKKKQTALHMAAKGHNVDLVAELVDSIPSLINMVDYKGNTALHIATKKGRVQIVEKLLTYEAMDTSTINMQGETALDTAERNSHSTISSVLSNHGVQSAKNLEVEPPSSNRSNSKELKQTVTVIKHRVHNQLQHTRQTRRRVQGMAKRLEKMQLEGLNNAINSTTVVAVLIATVAFAAIFSVPGYYAGEDSHEWKDPNLSVGEAIVGGRTEFVVFYVFDSFALFLSLAVVVVQTSVVVTERRAKKKLMAVINKLMWLACVMVSVAFLALSYIVVGDHDRVLAVGVTLIGTVIMATTLGTMCCWVVLNRLESSKLRKSTRRSAAASGGSPSWSNSVVSDSDRVNNNVYKAVYAI